MSEIESIRERILVLSARASARILTVAKADDSFAPPESAQSAARRGLELRRKWGRGGLSNEQASEQGIGSGVQRATNLANGNRVSRRVLGQMVGFFSRHAKNYRPDAKEPDGGPTAGTIAWLLWGGNAGKAWAESVMRRLEVKKDGEGASGPAVADGPGVSDVHVPGPLGVVPKPKRPKRVAKAGSDPKTPAKPSERVHGSDANAEGSASGERGGIALTPAIVEALRAKVEAHNGDAKDDSRKASLGQLKAVWRRGAGAFSTSHRPGVGRQQWAMGRVNAFLHLLRAGSPENANYTTDNDLLPKGHPRSTKD